MSDTTDVKQLTLNTKTVFNTSAAIERVKIHNNSSFFLRVYYGADAPTDPASGAGWHETIDPGGTPLCEVVGNSAQTFANRSYIQSTPYLGVITVMPFLPVGALQASGGVVSGLALCYLTAYYPGEWAQEGGEIEAYVQAAKQARYQDVDGGVNTSYSDALIDESTAAATYPELINLDNFNAVYAPNLFAANQSITAGAMPIWVYIYGIWLTLRSKGPQTARLVCSPFLRLSDSTGAVTRRNAPIVTSVELCASNFGVDRFALAPSKPFAIACGANFNALATGDIMWAGLQSVTVPSGGGWELSYVIQAGVDKINSSPLFAVAGFLGNQANVAFQPSSFNPQTY